MAILTIWSHSQPHSYCCHLKKRKVNYKNNINYNTLSNGFAYRKNNSHG